MKILTIVDDSKIDWAEDPNIVEDPKITLRKSQKIFVDQIITRRELKKINEQRTGKLVEYQKIINSQP